MSSSVDSGSRYHIDLEWYESHNRSFVALATSRLCSGCRDKVGKKGTKTEADLLKTIGQCCAEKPGFVAPSLPVMETVFRVFLSNGNEPLTINEIGQHLRQARAESFVPAADVLRRLLHDEGFYGIRCMDLPESEAASPEASEKEQPSEGEGLDSEVVGSTAETGQGTD